MAGRVGAPAGACLWFWLGPGVTSPKNRCQGCEPVTQAASSFPVSSRASTTGGVEHELSVDPVADVSLQGAQRFAVGLAGRAFAVVELAALGVGVADLHERGDVVAWFSCRLPRRESRSTESSILGSVTSPRSHVWLRSRMCWGIAKVTHSIEVRGSLLPRRWAVVIGAVLVAGVLALAVPAVWLSAERYSAYAAGVGALFVAVSILLAGAAIWVDSSGRRLDRTFLLHEQLVTGEVQGARQRLGALLRERHDADGPVYRPVKDDFEQGERLAKYDDESSGLPSADRSLILRYFERAEEARTANTVAVEFFLRTIGREACWWARAFERDTSPSSARLSLVSLAAWADGMRRETSDWGEQRAKDFPKAPGAP